MPLVIHLWRSYDAGAVSAVLFHLFMLESNVLGSISKLFCQM
jgi:hypothetical protein